MFIYTSLLRSMIFYKMLYNLLFTKKKKKGKKEKT